MKLEPLREVLAKVATDYGYGPWVNGCMYMHVELFYMNFDPPLKFTDEFDSAVDSTWFPNRSYSRNMGVDIYRVLRSRLRFVTPGQDNEL